MSSINNNNLYSSTINIDPLFDQLWSLAFPLQNVKAQQVKKLHPLAKLSNKAGRATGKAKHFFSKKETKSATLVAYWAADSLMAMVVLMTTSNPILVLFSLILLALHTYATFSAVEEMMK
jgi:hypothetical protein